MVETLKKAKLIDNVDAVVEIIMEREKLGSTGIGDGVAIPHGKMKNIEYYHLRRGSIKRRR